MPSGPGGSLIGGEDDQLADVEDAVKEVLDQLNILDAEELDLADVARDDAADDEEALGGQAVAQRKALDDDVQDDCQGTEEAQPIKQVFEEI